MLLLAAAAACADQPVTPSAPAGDESAPVFSASGRAPRDVPEVRIDLPPAPRKWDRDPAALAEAVAAGDGYAVVAFKEPGSARALATGKRGAVTAGTVRAGLQLLERKGAEVVGLFENIGAARVRIAPGVAAELAGHPLVDFVEPRRYGRVAAQTTPWGINTVHAPHFWSYHGVTGGGAKVLIIDTGHQQNHVDLPAVPTANCAGAYGGCNDGSGYGWHGTHVLGIVAARDNTDGVVGVAPGIAGSDIFVYGACDSSTGTCPTDEVTAGINAGIWDVHVMNLSLGDTVFDLAQSSAVAQAWNNGIVIVAAAGNNGGNKIVYPAGYTNVIGVSGVLQDRTFASTSVCGGSSNHGSHVDLAAPFEAYSTIGGNSYGTLCGTSMAAPHVTGVAALLKSRNPTWTNQQIVDTLFARAYDRGAPGRDDYYGHGVVLPTRMPKATITGPSTILSAGTYTWQAGATGGYGSYTYTWDYRVQGTTTWTRVGTAASYTRAVTLSDPPFELRLIVLSNGIGHNTTQAVQVGYPPVVVDTILGPTMITTAGSNTWTASASGGNGTYAYSWKYRVPGGAWATVGTGSSYTRNIVEGSPSFELRVTATSVGQTDSTSLSVFVEPWVYITGPTDLSRGETGTWTANPSGGNGTYTYQWQYQAGNSSTWSNVGTAMTYTRTAVLYVSFRLRVIVTSGGVSKTSEEYFVGVTP